MTPIISPMFIYVLSVVDNVINMFSILWWINVVCIVLLIMFGNDSNKTICKRYIKYNVLSFIIAILVAVFMPRKDTLIAMYVSQYVTIDNIKLGKEVVLDTIKDVVEIIDKKDEEEN